MRGLAASDPATIGRYRLLGVLGSGGMGRVLLGESRDGRLVAVKVVHPHLALAEDFRTRFRQEVAASRAVSGAYTAAVMDADPDAEVPWLASVFVPGPALSEAVTENGSMPVESVWRLAAGLAAALAEIHRAGVIHRDLKPSNVLLADDGPRVIDFGIARAAESTSLTHTGATIGSPAYMSPEQALGQRLTPATDVFSLGSVLHLAATGRGPFDGDSAPQILYQVVHGDPDLSGLPPSLAGLVTACLARDPAARPTPDDVLDRIPPGGDWPPPGVPALIEEQRGRVRELVTGSAETTIRTAPPVAPNHTRIVAPPTPPHPYPAPPPPTPPGFPIPAPAARPRPPWLLPVLVLALVLAIAVPVTVWAINRGTTPTAGSGERTSTPESTAGESDESTDEPADEPADTSTETEPPAEPDPYAIGPDGYLQIELGMDIHVAVDSGVVESLDTDPVPCASYEMYDQSGTAIGWVWIGDYQQIVIISPFIAVTTPEGVSVGATLDDVYAQYPDTTLTEAADGGQFAHATVPGRPDAVYAFGLGDGDIVSYIALQDPSISC